MRRWAELEEELDELDALDALEGELERVRHTLYEDPARVVDADPAPSPTYAQSSSPQPATQRGHARARVVLALLALLALIALVGGVVVWALRTSAYGALAWLVGLAVIGVLIGVLIVGAIRASGSVVGHRRRHP